MGDSSRVTVYAIEEVTRGTTPSSALETMAVPMGARGGLDTNSEKSSALRGDYIRPKTHIIDQSGSGEIPFELAYDDVPMLLLAEGVFRNDWGADVTNAASTISFTASTGVINDTGAGFTTAWANRWVRVSGSGSNNGDFYVTAATTTDLTVHATLGDAPLVDEIAGAAVTVKNNGSLLQGITTKYHTIERKFGDLSTTPYVAQTSCIPTGLNLALTRSIVTGSIPFVANRPSAASASSAGNGSFNAATTNPALTGSTEILAIFESGVTVAAEVSEINLSFSSPAAARHSLNASLDPTTFRWNSYEWSGSMNVYVDDNGLALWDKARTAGTTTTSLWVKMSDSTGAAAATGNTYWISLPQIRFTGGPLDVPAIDQDVYIDLPFDVEYHSTYGILGQIDALDAV